MIYGVLDRNLVQKRKFIENCVNILEGKLLEVKQFNKTSFDKNDLLLIMGIMRGLDDVYISAVEKNIPFIYFDNPYWGDLGPNSIYVRATKNAFQAHEFKHRDNKRSPKITYSTWGPKGDTILVIPPSSPYTMKVTNSSNWLENTISDIKQYTDRKIVIRTKKDKKRPLKHDFNKSYCVVVHSSRIAYEATIAGLPVITAPISCCNYISKKYSDIDTLNILVEPNREQLTNHLAYSQFNRAEFNSKNAWDILLNDK